jgi:hypothetical protein
LTGRHLLAHQSPFVSATSFRMLAGVTVPSTFTRTVHGKQPFADGMCTYS